MSQPVNVSVYSCINSVYKNCFQQQRANNSMMHDLTDCVTATPLWVSAAVLSLENRDSVLAELDELRAELSHSTPHPLLWLDVLPVPGG